MTRTDSDSPDVAKRQRIAKLMARVGLCSRRDAEAWIVAGRVSLNGTVLTSPAVDVSPADTILVDGAPLPIVEKTRLFLFHKPRGLVTTDHDPEGRETVADYLRENWPEGPRVVTIGRLDINTEGLLLLTNDGGLARLLELPQTGWVRRYRVRAKGTADPAALDALADGVTIEGIDYAGIEAKLDRTQGANTWLTMGLREGKNREIKRVLEHIGLEVNRLIRLSFGPFQLLDLPEGAIEEVRTRVLRDQLGETLAAKAGVDFGEVVVPQPARPEAPRKTDGRRRDAAPVERERPARRPRPDDRRPTPGRERRATPGDPPPPKRERPSSGPRKHVTAIRAERAAAPASGPRTRIERSATTDRRDRVVKVERLVSSDPRAVEAGGPRRHKHRPDADARPERPDRERRFGDRRSAPRRDGAQEGRGGRRDRNDRSDDRRSDRASPSAAGKRERIARSGARARDDAGFDDRKARPPRRGNPKVVGERGGGAASRRERPADKRQGSERPDQTGRGRPREDGRGPAKAQRAKHPTGAPPRSRPGRPPDRGGRKPPSRGPTRPQR